MYCYRSIVYIINCVVIKVVIYCVVFTKKKMFDMEKNYTSWIEDISMTYEEAKRAA